ncbi:MAG: methyltransferase domain-containing protein, partial [Candidatus Woesearchaeota archaeon]
MLRNNFILKYIKNKNVLDLGFLGENEKRLFSELHEFILDNSKSVLGVDIHQERISKLKEANYSVIDDDVIELKKIKTKGTKFEVIIAGELIEHLDDPGKFLNNLKNVLDTNGLIIFTTPNIFSLRYILRHLIFGQENPYWKNRKEEIKYGHVTGFSKMLLKNLLLRKGFEIIDFSYVIKNEYKGIKGNIEKLISWIFPKLSPQMAY